MCGGWEGGGWGAAGRADGRCGWEGGSCGAAGRADERLRLGLWQEGIHGAAGRVAAGGRLGEPMGAVAGRATAGERLGLVSVVHARKGEHALPRCQEEERCARARRVWSASRAGDAASSALTMVEDAVLG